MRSRRQIAPRPLSLFRALLALTSFEACARARPYVCARKRAKEQLAGLCIRGKETAGKAHRVDAFSAKEREREGEKVLSGHSLGSRERWQSWVEVGESSLTSGPIRVCARSFVEESRAPGPRGSMDIFAFFIYRRRGVWEIFQTLDCLMEKPLFGWNFIFSSIDAWWWLINSFH